MKRVHFYLDFNSLHRRQNQACCFKFRRDETAMIVKANDLRKIKQWKYSRSVVWIWFSLLFHLSCFFVVVSSFFMNSVHQAHRIFYLFGVFFWWKPTEIFSFSFRLFAINTTKRNLNEKFMISWRPHLGCIERAIFTIVRF